MVFLTRQFSRGRGSRETRCRRGTFPILITVKENILRNRNRRLRRLIPDSLRNRNRGRNTRSRRRKRHNYTPSTSTTGGVGWWMGGYLRLLHRRLPFHSRRRHHLVGQVHDER